MPDFAHTMHQLPEDSGVLLFQHFFVGAHTKHELRFVLQSTGLMRQTSFGELQSVTPEGEFCRRDCRHFRLWHQFPNPVDRFRETLAGLGFVRPMHQPRPDVATV
jgi:hypothetical protein